MKVQAILTGFAVVALLAGPGYSQHKKLGQVRGDSRQVLEVGAIGSPERPMPREFSGELLFPVLDNDGPFHAAQRPEPQVKGEASDVVAVKGGAREVEFVDAGEESAGREMAKRARMASGSTVNPAAFEPRGFLTSPINGSTLSGTQTFSWTRGEGIGYWLWIGSCEYCTDLLDADMGNRTSYTVNLPKNGQYVYVTLFTFWGGDWYWVNYKFVAQGSVFYPAQIYSPGKNSTLTSTQRFDWDPGIGGTRFWLWVGTCEYCTDLLDEDQGTRISRSLQFAATGKTIYVTLFTLVNGDWYWYDYQYKAPSIVDPVKRLTVTNKLGYAINLFVNGQSGGSVPAFETRYTETRERDVTLSFELVRPNISGRAIGDTMNGVFSTIYNATGNYSFTVDNRIGSQGYFSPWITNKSAYPMYVMVDGGYASENRCNCYAGVNTTNVAVGYYKLFSNGNIRLYTSSAYTGRYWFWGTNNGQVGTSGELPKLVEQGSGITRVSVSSAP